MKIIANIGTDLIKLGQSREQIRKILSTYTRSSFHRDKDEPLTDEYGTLGMFVYYSKDDLCDGIEFYREAEIYYEGHELFAMSNHELLQLLRHLDENIEIGFSDVTSNKLGIGFWHPEGVTESPEKIPESIMVFKDLPQ
ncbi:hypothetical protein [Spirochaeta cellobiosiphila]|uniref:hypothetical protein n=1 Tax=Spirochaeta cellobiosiphila TaxID=504483 RepID=UPI00041A0C92|nr:hypothetical protein [Spirochaeta cellobiosiphila]